MTTPSDMPATCTLLPLIVHTTRGTEGVRGRAYAQSVIDRYARRGETVTVTKNPDCTCPDN